MTLAQLRKKYVGKRVADSYAGQHSISIDSDAGDYEYFAEVTIDDDSGNPPGDHQDVRNNQEGRQVF